ncbi:MAG TPA: TetR/AcrR family transcriptional regulator [Mycobacteriales bacterium]|nr:TetR/AcrR family transcriptional regulator [Mycobacteriales bacterium]
MERTTLEVPELPPASGSPKRRPQRRDQILRAALKLFHERGYDATSMNDIGAATGITGPGIYRHFANKQEILEVAVLEAGARAVEQVNRVVDQNPDPQTRLRHLVRSFVALAIENPDLTVMGVRERRHLTPSTRRWVDRYDRRHRELWEDALLQTRKELTPDEAHVMVRGAASLCIGAVGGKTPLDRQALAGLVEAMVVAALGLPRTGRRGR